jgi:hypothetical protein
MFFSRRRDREPNAHDWVGQIWRDHVLAARRLSKNLGFTTVVALTLGLAIGGNAAIYSVVSGVLLKPLPYPDPDQLVRVFAQHRRFGDVPLTPADFYAFREDTPIFAGVAGFFREGHEFSGSAAARSARCRMERLPTSGFPSPSIQRICLETRGS